MFNIEGQSAVGADIVTYATLADMLGNSNRLGTHSLGGFGRNIVGSGSDGSIYWNVYNIEGESAVGARRQPVLPHSCSSRWSPPQLVR